MFSCLKVCAVLLLVKEVSQSQISDDRVVNSCDQKVTCSECIQTNECAWCMEPFMDVGRPRCFNSSLTTRYCEGNQWNPKNEQSLLSLQSLGSAVGSGNQSVVQISPQRIVLKLRLNEPLQIQFQYLEVKHFPIDLYFIMDLSKSMETDREKLLNLGEMLANTIPKITSNFRLGFGSFVNKIKSEQTAYAFKNHMPLGSDAEFFSDQLRKVAVSGNSTYYGSSLKPLEAIMQAVVCARHIGWRKNARRIIIISTNTGFDYAEDDDHYDGRCHLDSSDMYTESRVQDPNISQISKIIRAFAINLIFAVTSPMWRVYENLSNQVIGSSVAMLAENSDNVVELVRDEYNKISSTVDIKHNANMEVAVTYSSSCLGLWPIPTNRCDGLKSSDLVRFNAEIVVTSCPQNERDWKQTFQMYPVGVDQSLTVDLEILCGCQFENSSHCDGSESNTNCRPDNLTLVDCNGRGSCVCGICECNERPHHDELISGQFCECDNFSCERRNGLLCFDHGTCSCGVCQCQPGWTGDACDCRNTMETCRSSRGGEICSGHGTCECGTCRCDVSEDGRFSGRYCEKCPTCPGLCPELRTCVECQIYKTGPLAALEGMCYKNCTKIVTTGVDTIEADEEKNEHLCTFYDNDDCRFQFVYTDDSSNFAFEVRAQKERQCPQKSYSPLAVSQPAQKGTYDYNNYSHQPKCSNDNDLFTELEMKIILEEVFRGLRQCKTKQQQLQLMFTLAAKYIYRRP